MNPSFFPEKAPQPEPEHQQTPPWFQPPEDEYPVRVLLREFMARTESTSLAVSHVDVYSVGIAVKINWELRRREESAVEWQLATGMGHFSRGAGDENSERRFGLGLADGTVVTTVDGFDGHRNYGDQPEGWSLMDQGGGGGGGESRFSGSSRLWLWPLPPPGPIDLVAEWKARAIPESKLVLDGAALLSAVADVRPLWSGEKS
ncbi:MAG: hypothetical protein ACOH14_02455 [Rhodoglobus sp.]